MTTTTKLTPEAQRLLNAILLNLDLRGMSADALLSKLDVPVAAVLDLARRGFATFDFENEPVEIETVAADPALIKRFKIRIMVTMQGVDWADLNVENRILVAIHECDRGYGAPVVAVRNLARLTVEEIRDLAQHEMFTVTRMDGSPVRGGDFLRVAGGRSALNLQQMLAMRLRLNAKGRWTIGF